MEEFTLRNRKEILGGIAAFVISAFILSLVGGIFSFEKALVVEASDTVTLSATVQSWASVAVTTPEPAFDQDLVTTAGVGQIGTASTTLTMGTNHSGGLTVTIKGANGAEANPTELSGTGTNIVSGTAEVSGGTDGYGAQCTTGTGTTCTAPYNVSGNNVAVIPGVTQTAAGFLTGTTGAGRTATLTVKAASVTSRTAGSYTDTLTLTATPTT